MNKVSWVFPNIRGCTLNLNYSKSLWFEVQEMELKFLRGRNICDLNDSKKNSQWRIDYIFADVGPASALAFFGGPVFFKKKCGFEFQIRTWINQYELVSKTFKNLQEQNFQRNQNMSKFSNNISILNTFVKKLAMWRFDKNWQIDLGRWLVTTCLALYFKIVSL